MTTELSSTAYNWINRMNEQTGLKKTDLLSRSIEFLCRVDDLTIAMVLRTIPPVMHQDEQLWQTLHRLAHERIDAARQEMRDRASESESNGN